MSGIPAGAGSLLGKRLGKYEILALLALGGTAEIYLARIGGAAGFEKYVVVKCLHDHLADDPEFVKMFLDEARLAAHLDHSNIVQTMELGEHENRYYMVMEFLAGLSLAMIVRRAGERLPGGRIPVPLVLNMMAQACAGLHYAHERQINGKVLNIVHRDISPQNLVVSFEGVVKVVDFGIAKAEQRQTATRAGTIKGKFAYMSPEQCVATNVDRRTDIFALGVIAHELLTGRRLFKRNSPYETYQAVIECAVEPPSKSNVELEPALDAVIMKAVAREKENRYPTAEAFGDALLSYLHHRGKGSGPGDVSRFFDASYAQEIEEHGARMRELIQGRETFAVDTGVTWGSEDEDKRNETVDLSARKRIGEEKSVTLDSLDVLEDEPDDGDDEGDMPAERTRIESNPLDRIAEHEAAVQAADMAKAKAMPTVALQPQANAQPAAKPQPTAKSQPTATPQPASANNQGKAMPPSGPLPLPAPPVMPPGAAPSRPSGFPNLANLPTMVAEPLPELAETQLGGKIVDPSHGAEPATGGRASNRPTAPEPIMRGPEIQLGPTGYPVMSPEMSENIARGADIFPSLPPGRTSQPHIPHSTDSGAFAPQSGPHAMTPSAAHQAANLLSPVGPGYPQVDWDEAAAAPARALPTWMLALLFVAALGLALTITIVIAKIAR